MVELKCGVNFALSYRFITSRKSILLSIAIGPAVYIMQLDDNNIIESVDSIIRDGPDTPIICVIHYKHSNISEQVNL
jgi:hypothetical protein